MSSDTTPIYDLPTDSIAAGPTLDPTTVNQLINGIQQLGSTTTLPSRDIPQNMTQNLTQDPQIQPNYIPPTNYKEDYIQQYESNQELIHEARKKEVAASQLDSLYDEFQIPLLVAVIYFVFQMPFFKKALYRYMPALFFADGNQNLYGYAFTSVLFGVVFTLVHKLVQWI